MSSFPYPWSARSKTAASTLAGTEDPRAPLNKALPDLRLARARLEKSRLALLRGDLKQSRADAKAALKAFKKIWCTEDQEDTLHILGLVAYEPGFDYASPFRIE